MGAPFAMTVLQQIIDGRSPTLDLQAALVEQAKKMTPADLKSAAVRCGKELSARGAEVTRIGHNISGLGGGNQ